jgi:ribosomal protein L12E/L44/L45/RPP1/RPP2
MMKAVEMVKGVAGNVVTKVVEVIKKEDTTMETIKTNDVAEVAVNDANVKEDKDMTKADMRKVLKEAGVELSNTQFKKMLKAELKVLMEDTLEAKEIKPVEVAPEKVEVKVVDREEQNRRVLVSALVSVWVYQTTHKYNGKWSLFYDSKKYAGKKIASYKSLLKVTGDTLNALFGEERNTYDDIQDAWKKVANAGYCSIDNNGFVSIDNNQWMNCLVLSKAVNQQAVRSNAKSICGFLKGFTK